MSAARRRKKKKGRMSLTRRIALWAFLALALGYLLVAWAAISFVHHPKEWRREREQSWPGFATATLYWVGNGLSDLTDGLGLTGYDVVYEYDTEPPSGSALFAGAPKRVGNIQPADITVLDRGEFVVGWSPSLRRPVWCAYHVVPDVLYQTDKRPNFTRELVSQLREAYGGTIKVFDTEIPKSIRMTESNVNGKSVYGYDPKNPVGRAYEALTREVIEHDKALERIGRDVQIDR